MSMTSVNMKYLKDENGNIVSPVTSASSVYTEEGISVEGEFIRHSTYYLGGAGDSARVNNSVTFTNLTNGNINFVSFECRIGSQTEEYTYFSTGKYPVRLNKSLEISQSCAFGAYGMYVYSAHYTLTDTQLTYNAGKILFIYDNNGDKRIPSTIRYI